MVLSTTVEPIKAYSFLHLVVCLLVVLTAALLVRLLRHLNKEKLIFFLGVGLAISEVLKELLMVYIYGAYSWSDFPFQLCSIPMYLCLLYPFCKKGQGFIELFFRSFGILGAIFAFAVPSDVFSEYLLLSLHSGLWHLLLLFLGLYCIAVPTVRQRGSLVTARNIRKLALFYLALALMAVCINALFYGISGGTANMFFLGPADPHALILRDLYRSCGWIVESMIMIAANEFAGILVLLLGEWLGKKRTPVT